MGVPWGSCEMKARAAEIVAAVAEDEESVVELITIVQNVKRRW